MKNKIAAVMISLILPVLAENLSAQTPLYLDPKQPINTRVEDLLGRMTTDEKIGQLMQADHTALNNGKGADVANYFMGSILSGGDSKTGDNTTPAWIQLYDSLQTYALTTRLKIPIIYGVDAVHGNNDLTGTTIFPHNIGLGASRNPALVEKAARITAVEVAAAGIDWTFAPCIAVPRDERWGRTYEGFGETPELAELLGAAAVKGFQGDSLSGRTSILACSKHYLGDGGTLNGTDQGNMVLSEAEIRKIHLPGYIAAVKAGVGSIMTSYSSINGQKMHGYKYWLTDVLKKELGFKGFVVSDYAGIDQLSNDYKAAVEASVNAGIDMVMLPSRYADFQSAMRSLISEGKITMERVNDAVRRILAVKFQKGLFEEPFADKTLQAKVGSAEHRAAARECVRESIVLLKRKDGVLPLPKSNARILVAGSHADDIGNQCGGWTVSWQGKSGATTAGTTILAAMKKAAPSSQIDFSLKGDFTDTKADYSVVMIGEKPYAEGQGDRADLTIAKSDVELIKKMKSCGAPVVVIIISGRPLILEQILHFSDAVIAAWLPGTEGEGVADVLFGDFNPKGLLSHSWPKNMAQIPVNIGDADYKPLYEYGYGILSYQNSQAGSSPLLLSSIVKENGKQLELTFSKDIDPLSLPGAKFSFIKNQSAMASGFKASLKTGDKTTVVLDLDSAYENRTTAAVSYISGNIKSLDGGILKPFQSFEAYNWANPVAVKIPSVIQASKYTDMFGIQTEVTNDEGGGMNLTSVDDNDWFEYFINVTTPAQYFLSLRIASESQQGTIAYTSGTKTSGSRTLPSTGSWNTWTTVKQVVPLYAGEQTLRITAKKGGFKLHWLSIDPVSSSAGKNDPVIPLENRLEQNYPNPFNPSTEIIFTVKKAGLISLKVFDTLGREVKTLINQYAAAGSHAVSFNASDLPSGIYYYSLTGSGFSLSRKLLLIK